MYLSLSPDVTQAQAQELNLVPAQEEGEEEDISGPQFVCETVIRSLTLEEAPDRSRLCSSIPSKCTHAPLHTRGDRLKGDLYMFQWRCYFHRA